jgi:predicted phage tail protein
MSDDIVEQLNHWADWNDGKTTVSPIEDPLVDSLSRTMREAADEIERLRSEWADAARNCISQMVLVEELHELITAWADASDDLDGHPSDYHQNVAEAEDALRKAVGHESHL